ncbi:hypothetical protein PR003_g16387 [Phytophthora rubi]|uniref:Ubiquitin-like protease family profile domain-containing protein n=1 Tax=Phytophthora rubi TaxID=129364 RepID=A0A6A4EGU9_9STRA|nr:hypothetical protein PR001_g15536 [Phytophthora rubi]KAE9325812.1 hypothetical protein PR003_g16387 [Phytophthora rubi]
MFDPLQSDNNYKVIEKSMGQVVEDILGLKGELVFERITWCKQQDNSSCGICCLAVLEMLITDALWDDSIYKLVPYLRMRYLYKAIGFIDRMAVTAEVN